jgi:5'-deoxynucleotidase YfbR-like HD superfamily hydrolase
MYMLYHDAAEVITGDVPFQIKRIISKMKSACSIAETYATEALNIPIVVLTPQELRRVKIADLREMREYAEIEVAYGNRTAEDIIDNINTALLQMAKESADDYTECLG